MNVCVCVQGRLDHSSGGRQVKLDQVVSHSQTHTLTLSRQQILLLRVHLFGQCLTSSTRADRQHLKDVKVIPAVV